MWLMNSVKGVMIYYTIRLSKDRQMLVACSAAVDVCAATVNSARSLNNKTELTYTTIHINSDGTRTNIHTETQRWHEEKEKSK